MPKSSLLILLVSVFVQTQVQAQPTTRQRLARIEARKAYAAMTPEQRAQADAARDAERQAVLAKQAEREAALMQAAQPVRPPAQVRVRPTESLADRQRKADAEWKAIYETKRKQAAEPYNPWAQGFRPIRQAPRPFPPSGATRYLQGPAGDVLPEYLVNPGRRAQYRYKGTW
jgi:hypothetical protein